MTNIRRRAIGRERAARGPGWMVWLLVASLTLNLVWAGGLIGGAMRIAMTEDEAKAGTKVERFVRFLPESQHAAWMETMAESDSERRALHNDMAAVHDRVVAALRHRPFDAATVSAALAERRALNERVRATMHEGIATVARGMTMEERLVFADRLDVLATEWAKRNDVALVER